MSDRPGSDHIWRKAYRHVNTSILAGVLVVIPLIITWLVVKFFFDLFTDFFDLLPIAPDRSDTFWRTVAIVSALVSMVIIFYILGRLGRTVVGNRVVGLGHRVMEKIPWVQFIYKASKETVDALQVMGKSDKKFGPVVLLEYPSPGILAIGFVTGHFEGPNGQRLVAVYIPTAPTPTSGLLAIVEEDQIIPTNVSVEDCMRMVISCGLLSPAVIGKSEDLKGKAKVDETKV